jgi:hypothetical protein
MPVEYMITLEPTDNIDHYFLAIVERILNNTLRFHRPAGVYVVLIDNWFDHKWLEFDSNKNENDASGWRTKLVLPPFEPSRVLSQSYFHARPSAPLFYEASSSNPLHILTSSRSVGQICSSGVFVWYSYVGEKSDRGSLMIYLSEDGEGSAWYAAFTKNPEWQVGKMKGLSKREFTELMTGISYDGRHLTKPCS